MAKKVNKTDEQFANVEENLSKAGLYVEKNLLKIGIVTAIILIIIISFIYLKNNKAESLNKLQQDASSEMYIAEFYFQNNDYDKALNGDSILSIDTIGDTMISFHKGFIKISKEYSSTNVGNIANYYAAICQMNLGSSLDSIQYFENALSSLNNFSTKKESSGVKNMIKKYWWILLDICIIGLLLYFLYFKKQKIKKSIPYLAAAIVIINTYGVYSINNSKKESVNEIISSLATGLKGDAKMELGDTTESMNFYKSAATDNANSFTTPYFMMKQARIHEFKKEFTLSLEIYNTIKSDYPESKEGINIDKYITSASNR